MKRFSGHTEPWGSFIDVKLNAPEVLRRHLRRAHRGSVLLSSVTDPYQPAEATYELTRKCLDVLAQFKFPVNILTKSPLVTRDIDIISNIEDAEVGLTITTDDEEVRKVFEPCAPPVADRIKALKKLYKAGINTFVFIGPVLPMNHDYLAEQIAPYANRILIDRMNYIHKTKGLYKRHNIEKWCDNDFIENIIMGLQKNLSIKDVTQICSEM
jgi:DNA repair photolyase